MNCISSKKIRVVYIVSTLSRTGPTNQLFDVIKHINLEKFEIYIFSLSQEPVDSRFNDFLQLGINYACLNYTRISWLLGGSLKKHISNLCPNIIHSHGVRADIVSAMLNVKGAKKIATVHNYPVADYRMLYGPLKGSLMAYLQLHAFKKIDRLVAVSKSVHDNLTMHHGFQCNNVEIINNGVEVILPSKDKKLIRSTLDILCENETVWAYAASFVVRKNHVLLLEAWRQMPENNHLLLLGEGPLLDELKSKFIKFKNVHFLGQVPDIINYLNCSDYYLSPSLAEGFPVAVLEALSLGKPALLSNIEPHQELLDSDLSNGGFGAIFENNTNALISSINEIEKKNYNLLSSNARELILSKFNAMEMSHSYQNLYSILSDDC